MTDSFMAFLETLPESIDPVAILREFFQAVAEAKDILEVNIAAGNAWNALRGAE